MSKAPERRSEQLVHRLAAGLGAVVLETHISWILLAPRRAYKIKKPVRTGFLDYSGLAERLRCCREEVRLNARFAPGLYLGVAPITGTVAAPVLDGRGPAIEYAVAMHRFPEGALFSERLASGQLQPADVDDLGDWMANIHSGAAVAPPASGYGSSHRKRAVVQDLLQALGRQAGGRALHAWLDAEQAKLAPSWDRRAATGHVRECHGDLHLANILRLPGGVAAFDAIEFDPALRCIDVLDDAAFPVMDLAAHGRWDLAFRLLNRWLDGTGEHEALPLLRHAAVQRALVRASVELMRHPGSPGACRTYLDNAREWTRPARMQLTIMHGLPGSGKTFVSQQMLEHERAIRLRSDVERKRLFGIAPQASSAAGGLDIYTPAATRRTYQRLLDLARIALDAGLPVILDAAFLRRDERAQARSLARSMGIPFSIVSCDAPADLLRARLGARHGDASEADAHTLSQLQACEEPLDIAEMPLCRQVHTA
ncbi:MAG TPA: AAA family ATPase [Ramlibacter sp.]